MINAVECHRGERLTVDFPLMNVGMDQNRNFPLPSVGYRTHPMFGPTWLQHSVTIRRSRRQPQGRTSKKRNSSDITTELDVVRDEIALQPRTSTQSRMPEFLKVHPGSIALNELGPARWFAQCRGGLRQAEEAVQFREDPDGAQPHATVSIELSEEPVLELLDSSVTVLSRFLEFSDGRLQRGHDPSHGSLEGARSYQRM